MSVQTFPDNLRKVFCWNCWNNRDKTKKKRPETYKVRVDKDGFIRSAALLRHLQDNRYTCLRHYHANLGGTENGFKSSMLNLCPHGAIQESFRKYELGLTRGVEQSLDWRVTYNPFVEPLESRLIQLAMHNVGDTDDVLDDTGYSDCVDDTDATEGTGDDTDATEGTGDDSVPTECTVDDTDPTYLPLEEPIVLTTPTGYRGVSDVMKVKIKLMKIFRNHNIPIAAEREIYEWAAEAHHMEGFSWDNGSSGFTKRESTMKELFRTCPELEGGDAFKPKLVHDWKYKVSDGVLPAYTKKKLYVRSFGEALRSLITNKTLVQQDNLSFPNKDTPMSPMHNPPINNDTYISELHHGTWWTDTWKEKCREDKSEILVPIILYMDGIAIDTAGRNTLCPLNMTLGIFSDEIRSTRPDAWETLYYHPEDKADDAIGNLKNLHSALRCALSSLRKACEQKVGYVWSNLPWNNKLWSVRMKFAIAFVIGDTELHDKLCGHYGCRTKTVAQICRHCNCPTKFCNIPREALDTTKVHLWTPQKLKEKFDDPVVCNKDISHYDVNNAFYDIDFGVNKHNIHLATPGEKLHMHQLGSAKRAVETFITVFLDGITRGKTTTIAKIEAIARYYGHSIPRQSDRDFPRTRFSESMNTSRKEGNHFAGMIFTQMLSLVCSEGRKLLISGGISEKAITERIYALELVLGMEEFLKYSGTRKQINQTEKMFVHFVNILNTTLKRVEGAGNLLIKIHMLLHYAEYIRLFGPPSGFDSAPSESNHKTEVKAPAKRTQLNKATLIKQTCDRHLEYRRIDRLHREFPMFKEKPKQKPGPDGLAAGSRFTLGKGDEGPFMKWVNSKNKKVPPVPPEVLQFICDEVLQTVEPVRSIEGFTEHHRYDPGYDQKYFFRAHPCYRSEIGQTSNVWYDWAIFDVRIGNKPRQKYPCRIMCFLSLKGPFTGAEVRGFELKDKGLYAVVQAFLDRDCGTQVNAFVKKGVLRSGLYLFPCNSIHGEVAVVPNKGTNEYFVLANRNEWLESFRERMLKFENTNLEALLDDGIETPGKDEESDCQQPAAARPSNRSNRKRKHK